MKQELLALKWAIAEQFQEYLLWKLFIDRTDNNPPTYIMNTAILDATQHQWVESLARFTVSIKYQKGWGNAAADALSQVTSKLYAEIMKSILDGVTIGMTERMDTQDPVVAKADEEIHKPVQETMSLAQTAYVSLHMTDWVTAQQEDPILKTMIEWTSGQKVQDLKHLLGNDANTEEGKIILQEWKNLMLYQEALYHCHTPLVNWKKFCDSYSHSSLSSCHEWMSPRCWTAGSAANTLPARWLVLEAGNGHSDAECD